MKWQEMREIGNRLELIEYTLENLTKETSRIALQNQHHLALFNANSTFESEDLLNKVFIKTINTVSLKQQLIEELKREKADLEGRLDPIRLEF